MTTEATITINGYTLTPAQAMTLRKASEAFLDEMRLPDILGHDELGRNLASAFARRCEEIHALIRLGEKAAQLQHPATAVQTAAVHAAGAANV